MPIKVECDCGRVINAPETAAGKRVKCPECHGSVPVPAAAEPDVELVEEAPVKRKSAPRVDDEIKPVIEREDEDDEAEEEPKPKKKRKKRRADDESDDDGTDPFWKTREGMILNGLGVLGLGVAGIAIYFFDKRRSMGALIAGIVCVLAGIGGVIAGLTKPTGKGRKKRRRNDDEDE